MARRAIVPSIPPLRSQFMHLRLWQRLFLTIAALSSVALAGFAIWQQQGFRRGFLGYLDEVALERLEPAASRLAAAYAEHESWAFLHDDEHRFSELIEPDPRRSMRGEIARDFPAGPPPPPDGERMFDPRRGDRPPPGTGRGSGPPRFGPPGLMSRLLLLDNDGKPVVGNPAISNSAANLPIELDGRHIGTLVLESLPQLRGPADLAFAREQLRNALIASIAVLAAALLLAFALARWLLDPVRALAAGTRALAAGDYAQRIEEKRSDELGALAHDFNHLATTLEQHREARRRWGADIAHELRTPLSILRGEIQALQDGVRTPTAQALASLHAECERMGGLVEDLYQLALADAGALEYRFEELDPAEIMRESLDMQRHSLADAGLTLEEAIGEVPAIRADARRIGQLIDNLLANARRYTDAPGRIRAEVSASDNAVSLIIEDSAPGVPQDSLPYLFDRLYRVERSRNRAAGGAGLGLAICQAIVAAHGGQIEASDSPLGGLRISMRFPLLVRTP
jgi:two-component system sensor histidine kinase BaeS